MEAREEYSSPLRRFVIGDIHGHYNEMMDLFGKVRFDYERDLLISLGDLVDRGPDPLKVIGSLTKIRRFIHVLGNHDDWCLQYLMTGIKGEDWISQGGESTIKAYEEYPEKKPEHLAFFRKALLYFIDNGNRLFVHGGFNPQVPFHLQKDNKDLLVWDRSLILTVLDNKQLNKVFGEFSEIFVGHTPTLFAGKTSPIHIGNIWMLDTGIYLSGRLTLMDIDTKEYWQSPRTKNYFSGF